MVIIAFIITRDVVKYFAQININNSNRYHSLRVFFGREARYLWLYYVQIIFKESTHPEQQVQAFL
jgi:hypothetical protein